MQQSRNKIHWSSMSMIVFVPIACTHRWNGRSGPLRWWGALWCSVMTYWDPVLMLMTMWWEQGSDCKSIACCMIQEYLFRCKINPEIAMLCFSVCVLLLIFFFNVLLCGRVENVSAQIYPIQFFLEPVRSNFGQPWNFCFRSATHFYFLTRL